ncbi:MAG: hypothetical protein JWO74_1869 [Solirubrobacterales bacterium]|nr:hypothetical protein [Solirubrobacterales bacterium]
MAKEIGALVVDLLSEADQVDSGRANELRKELGDSLNALANRIDRGYSVEVRAGELPEADDAEEPSADEDDERLRRQAELVLSKQERLWLPATGLFQLRPVT